MRCGKPGRGLREFLRGAPHTEFSDRNTGLSSASSRFNFTVFRPRHAIAKRNLLLICDAGALVLIFLVQEFSWTLLAWLNRSVGLTRRRRRLMQTRTAK